MAIIAEAPPGVEPQAAVLPGMMPDFINDQPTSAPASIELPTMAPMTSQ